MGFNADKCLKFVAEEDGCQITLNGYEFSNDDGTNWYWNTITINTGEHAYVRGNAYPIGTNCSISKKARIESGNIMSLVDGGLGEQTTIDTENAFKWLFYKSGSANLTSVPLDFLPATQLAAFCYESLFANCKFLEIPPELPATELETSCYENMFVGCSGITKAPELPATQLVSRCYYGMFNGCTSLSEIKVHFTEWPTDSEATQIWVSRVPDNGKFYCPEELPKQRGKSYIPENWTINPPLYKKGSIIFFGHSMPIK